MLGPEALARACHEAGVRYRTTPSQVEAVLARRPNAPGATKLRSILRGDVKVTLSRLERGFNALLEGDGVELPETNRPAGAHARGDDFRRYTWGDVFDRPEQVLRELRPLLRDCD